MFSSSLVLQDGATALMLAISHGRFAVIRILLDARVNANLQDEVSGLMDL